VKVLIVHPGVPIYGGAEVVIANLIRYLNEKGISNTYLTTRLNDGMKKALGDTDIIISGNRTGTRVEEVFFLWKGVHAHLSNYDVVNAHNFPAHISVFPSRKPTVWMCNEPPEMFTSLLRKPVEALGRFVARNWIQYTVVSDEVNAEAFKTLYGFRPEIIHYGIDYEFFLEGGGQRDVDNFTILHVGSLTPYKNQLQSIKVVEELAGRIPNIRLVLAGWGQQNYVGSLKKYVEDKRIKDRVVFAGNLAREEVRNLYHTCDVLLHPIGPQGGWLTPFEALCANLPVVTSREFTASYIIERENIGIVTDNYTVAIWDIYQKPEKYAGIAERGQLWVKDNLGWDKFCEKMVELLFKAAGEKNEL